MGVPGISESRSSDFYSEAPRNSLFSTFDPFAKSLSILDLTIINCLSYIIRSLIVWDPWTIIPCYSFLIFGVDRGWVLAKSMHESWEMIAGSLDNRFFHAWRGGEAIALFRFSRKFRLLPF
jgi:hypothetical protein